MAAPGAGAQLEAGALDRGRGPARSSTAARARAGATLAFGSPAGSSRAGALDRSRGPARPGAVLAYGSPAALAHGGAAGPTRSPAASSFA